VSASVAWASTAAFITIVIVVGVYMIVRLDHKLSEELRDARIEIREREFTIRKQAAEIMELKVELTRKIHNADD